MKFKFAIPIITKVMVRKTQNPIWPQAAILNLTSSQNNRLLEIVTSNILVHMQFGFDIPIQTKATVQNPCRPWPARTK